jgi:hypothetical protein
MSTMTIYLFVLALLSLFFFFYSLRFHNDSDFFLGFCGCWGEWRFLLGNRECIIAGLWVVGMEEWKREGEMRTLE